MENLNSQLAFAFKNACIKELEALKPGNVHVFADGHGMTIEDFLLSADAVSQVIALPNITLGQRILYSVQATQKAVACNTNLGIILLSAPLIHAALMNNKKTITHNLKLVLANTSIEDAHDTFSAIRLANPAGLGKVNSHDVHQPASCTLLEAMQSGAQSDFIARQYSNDFTDIFSIGILSYEHAYRRLNNDVWSITALYLTLLSRFRDSHVMKKNGDAVAKEILIEANLHLLAFNKLENPKLYVGKLLTWDAQLKSKGINPGTTADLTVATLLYMSVKSINNENLHYN